MKIIYLSEKKYYLYIFIIIKKMNPDGNCFYRDLSYYFRENENDFNEFRILISENIINNLEKYIDFVSECQLNVDENKKDELNCVTLLKKEYIKKYGENAKKNSTFAGDIEINTIYLLFN